MHSHAQHHPQAASPESGPATRGTRHELGLAL